MEKIPKNLQRDLELLKLSEGSERSQLRMIGKTVYNLTKTSDRFWFEVWTAFGWKTTDISKEIDAAKKRVIKQLHAPHGPSRELLAARIFGSARETAKLTALTLTQLDKRSNVATIQAALKELGATSDQAWPHMTTLSFCNAKIGDEGIEKLCALLETQAPAKLKSLNFAGCELSDRSAVSLANMLRKNSTIATLNLDQNTIGDEGFKALMSGAHTLQELSLRHNSLTPAIYTTLLAATKRALPLQLQLSHNPIAEAQLPWEDLNRGMLTVSIHKR